jgi:general nucleoside transport system permease protein
VDVDQEAPEGGMTSIAARLRGIRWTEPKTVGIGGIVIGAVALWLALPPLSSRTVLAPIALGILAIATGIWAWSREQRRLGGGAVAAGLLGIVLGVLATRSSTAHLDTVVVWSALLAATLRYATPLTFAAIGGLFCERSGVINVALEGMLLTGAFFGIWGAIWAHGWAPGFEWVIGLVTAALAGMAMATIHAVWAIHLKVDQIISGTALNFLALGITGYIFIDKYGDTGTPGNVADYGIPDVHIHFLQDWYFVGPILGQLNLMIWASFVLLIATYIFVFRTPYGLRLRSVGEHPRAADTVGISVYKVRYIAVISSGAIAAMGGAYLSLGFVHSFNENMTSGTGFIGLAALVFGKWRPFPTWGATLLFGFSSALADRLPNAYGNQWGTLFQALPYVLTLVAVAGVIGRSIGPAAAGRPYEKQ